MERCPLTLLPVFELEDTTDLVRYSINLPNGMRRFTLWKASLEEAPAYVDLHFPVIRGLILNGKFPTLPHTVIYWTGDTLLGNFTSFDLRVHLAGADYPRSPKEKLEFLFLALYHRQEWDGDRIKTNEDQRPESYGAYYLTNPAEYKFYLAALTQQGLLEEVFPNSGHRLSYAGLNRVIELQESGVNSNRCFIAMSFSDEERIHQIRQAIKEACIATGFVPILIDEVYFDSDITINDAMIAEIKRCKFCIADFTQQKDGVYFESGFAAGRGLKVLYTCHRDDRKGRHFDVRAFPFLYYDDVAALKSGLINKINAWVID